MSMIQRGSILLLVSMVLAWSAWGLVVSMQDAQWQLKLANLPWLVLQSDHID